MKRTGFTLLELIVVIGIIALATAVMLPAAMSLRGGANDLVCQSNLRQIYTALYSYNNDNKGSMPYGYYWRIKNPVTWGQPLDQDVNNSLITWVDVLNQYLSPGSTSYSSLFQCPEALAVHPHPNSYVMNIIIGISPQAELVISQPPYAQLKPPNVNLMLDEGSALIWDTAIRPNWQEDLGHLISADLDGQRFWNGARAPQFRSYSAHDPFGPGPLGNNRPVALGVGANGYFNKDPGTVEMERWPYQGNLRFRHNGNTTCNTLFSDGSVRQFTAVVNPNLTVNSHNALRRYFMIHWLPGTPPNPSFPF